MFETNFLEHIFDPTFHKKCSAAVTDMPFIGVNIFLELQTLFFFILISYTV